VEAGSHGGARTVSRVSDGRPWTGRSLCGLQPVGVRSDKICLAQCGETSLAGRHPLAHASVMFSVSEAEAAAIRTAFEQGGEFSAAAELRRLFPGITDNGQARECARVIVGWTPLPPRPPRLRRREALKRPPRRRAGTPRGPDHSRWWPAVAGRERITAAPGGGVVRKKPATHRQPAYKGAGRNGGKAGR
jgi:hypothetical protein